MGIALVIGVGMGAMMGATMYTQSEQASEDRKLQREAMAREEANMRQAKDEKDRADRERILQQDEIERQATLRRLQQRKRDYANTGRGDTILTSPMGVPGKQPDDSKTLLGY